MLVDTKYEFGLDAEVMLTIIDEVTPRTRLVTGGRPRSRRRAAGDEPENLDKEYVRLAYVRDGYDKVSELPLPEHLALEAASVYQEIYAALTRRAFEPAGIPPPSGLRQRCSPTMAEPTIFCLPSPRCSGRANMQTGDGLPGKERVPCRTVACRRDHGQRLRLGDDVAGCRHPRTVRRAVRGEGRQQVSHARLDGRIRRDRRAARHRDHHRWRRRAAHLPGMVAGHTIVPVIGVPIKSRTLNGMDSRGRRRCPVASPSPPWRSETQAPGLFAVAMLARHDEALAATLTAFGPNEPLRFGRSNLSTEAVTTSLAPGSTIGIVGGQLGRMLAQSARQHGYGVVVLTGVEKTPAGVLADREITGAFDDPATVAAFLQLIDAMTWEFENVDPAIADAAEAAGVPARPAGSTRSPLPKTESSRRKH